MMNQDQNTISTPDQIQRIVNSANQGHKGRNPVTYQVSVQGNHGLIVRNTRHTMPLSRRLRKAIDRTDYTVDYVGTTANGDYVIILEWAQ